MYWHWGSEEKGEHSQTNVGPLIWGEGGKGISARQCLLPLLQCHDVVSDGGGDIVMGTFSVKGDGRRLVVGA